MTALTANTAPVTNSDNEGFRSQSRLERFRNSPLREGFGLAGVEIFKRENPYPLIAADSSVQFQHILAYDYTNDDIATALPRADIRNALASYGFTPAEYTLDTAPIKGMNKYHAAFTLEQLAFHSAGFGVIIDANCAPRDTVKEARHSNNGEKYSLVILPNNTIIHGYLDSVALAPFKTLIEDGTASAFHLKVDNKGTQFRSWKLEPYATADITTFVQEVFVAENKGRLIATLKEGGLHKAFEEKYDLIDARIDPASIPDLPKNVVVQVDNFHNAKTGTLFNEAVELGLQHGHKYVFAAQGIDGQWRSLDGVFSHGHFEVPTGTLSIGKGSSDVVPNVSNWGDVRSTEDHGDLRTEAFLRKANANDEGTAAKLKLEPGCVFAVVGKDDLKLFREKAGLTQEDISDAKAVAHLSDAGLVNGFDATAFRALLAENRPASELTGLVGASRPATAATDARLLTSDLG